MFIKEIEIDNYRLFDSKYIIDEFNIPDEKNIGSGITLIVGSNGSGKTTILDSIGLCLFEYKASLFKIDDMNDFHRDTSVIISSNKAFTVPGCFPKTEFEAKGFKFKAGVRINKSKQILQEPLVFDQYFISVNSDNPKEGSPDLRLNVYNPFSGKRFNDTDILFLDKNRTFQMKSGNYNNTRFDRLMCDFNTQYIKAIKNEGMVDLNEDLNNKIKIGKIENNYLKKAIEEFEGICGKRVKLDFISNSEPFLNSKFVVKEKNNIQIPLSNIGSGYEMVFSILYSYYLAKQSRKNMIIVIDEPELHLHSEIQMKLVDFLLSISKETQIILTSHSPVFVKQLLYNSNVKTIVINNDKTFSKMGEFKLSYLSANEINYLAFNYVTEEYHNELYEEINIRYNIENKNQKEFDDLFFIKEKKEERKYPYKGKANMVSLHTFIRNQIHHRKENGNPDYNNLEKSIKIMRSYL